MITGAQPKILLNVDENGNLQMDSEMGKLLFGGNNPKWKLVRERDGLTKVSEKIMWIEFDEVGRFRDKWDNIGVGRSLLMSPFNEFFTWQTTVVTEVVEEKEDYMKFKTRNSNYELFKLKDNE